MNARQEFTRHDGPPKRYRVTVADYHRMGDAGVFDQHRRVQLLQGEIVEIAPVGSHHASITQLLFEHFLRTSKPGRSVRCQQPITLNDESEPEPDIAVVRGATRDFMERHPSASDVALIIEVAHSTLELDRGVKASLYAEHAIPEYWIVNVAAKTIERYSAPIDGRYTTLSTFAADQIVSPHAMPECSLSLAQLLAG
jgi:Uma2 family endonuclease